MTTGLPQLVRSAGGAAGRRVVRDSSTLLLVAQLVSASSAFVVNILAARTLGPSGRGELALLLQIAYFGTLGVVLGCDRSVVAVYAGNPARTVARGFARLLLRPSAVTLVAIAVILALPLPPLESWRLRLALAALFMVVNSLTRAVRSVAIASGRMRQYAWSQVAEAAVLLTALLALTAAGLSATVLWMLAYLLSGLVSGAGWLWWWARSPGGRDGSAPDGSPSTVARSSLEQGGDDSECRRRARTEGLQLLPATIAHSGTLRIDRLVLAGLASTAALGLYAGVATMTELITWPLLVFADSRLGIWRQAHDRGTLSLRRVVVTAAVYSVVAAGLSAVALHLLLVPVLGHRYAAALPLVLPLSLAAAVFGLSQLFVTALTAVRRGPLSSAVEVTGLVVSVVAYVTLIQRFGALGAAYGSLIGYSTCLGLAALLFTVFGRSRAARPALVTPPVPDRSP